MASDECFGSAELAECLGWFSEPQLAILERELGRGTPDDSLRFELALLLWKSIRNRLASDQGNHLVADVEAALWDLMGHRECKLDEISRVSDDIRKLAASVSTKLDQIAGPAKGGRPPATEDFILVGYLRRIELKLTGCNTSYTYNSEKEEHSGRLFVLLKTFKIAIARALDENPPMDSAIAGIIRRANKAR
jgi:hypothetical protein